MPLVEIKAAIAGLLTASFGATPGDGRLAVVSTQFPRAGVQVQPSDFPKATVASDNHAPVVQDGNGRNVIPSSGPIFPLGEAMRVWAVFVHLMNVVADVDTVAGGDAFDQLCDDVETMLMQYPTLGNANGTTTAGNAFNGLVWNVEWSGSLRRQDLPPVTDEERVAYNAVIYLNVRERIRV